MSGYVLYWGLQYHAVYVTYRAGLELSRPGEVLTPEAAKRHLREGRCASRLLESLGARWVLSEEDVALFDNSRLILDLVVREDGRPADNHGNRLAQAQAFFSLDEEKALFSFGGLFVKAAGSAMQRLAALRAGQLQARPGFFLPAPLRIDQHSHPPHKMVALQLPVREMLAPPPRLATSPLQGPPHWAGHLKGDAHLSWRAIRR